jgi:hypothetical protein
VRPAVLIIVVKQVAMFGCRSSTSLRSAAISIFGTCIRSWPLTHLTSHCGALQQFRLPNRDRWQRTVTLRCKGGARRLYCAEPAALAMLRRNSSVGTLVALDGSFSANVLSGICWFGTHRRLVSCRIRVVPILIRLIV